MHTHQWIIGCQTITNDQHTVHRHGRSKQCEQLLAAASTQFGRQLIDLGQFGMTHEGVPLPEHFAAGDAHGQWNWAEHAQGNVTRR